MAILQTNKFIVSYSYLVDFIVVAFVVVVVVITTNVVVVIKISDTARVAPGEWPLIYLNWFQNRFVVDVFVIVDVIIVAARRQLDGGRGYFLVAAVHFLFLGFLAFGASVVPVASSAGADLHGWHHGRASHSIVETDQCAQAR